MMELYVKLVELRKKCGISQSDAATRIGVSRQTISKWESGTVMPDMKNLSLIAEVYSVSVEDLLREDFDIDSYAAEAEDEVIEPEIAVSDEGTVENAEENASAEVILPETEDEEEICDAEECDCDCCCEECDETSEVEDEKPAKKVYNQVKTKIITAKNIASEKLATVSVPKKATIASLAAVCGTSLVLAASLKKGPAKTSAAIVAGASFAIGAGIILKDIYDNCKAKKAECDCDSDCCCECEEIIEECCCESADVEE